jgi:hypothetical protein
MQISGHLQLMPAVGSQASPGDGPSWHVPPTHEALSRQKVPVGQASPTAADGMSTHTVPLQVTP